MTNSILLHIGTHKTGSSSIQASLLGYDDGTTFYATFSEPNHSIALYTAFCDDPFNYHIWTRLGLSEEQVQEQKNLFLDEFSNMLSRPDRRNLIVSGEDIGVLSDAGKRRLLDFIRRHDVAVKLLCYVRDPRSYAASATQEAVKNGFVLDDMVQIRGRCMLSYRVALEFFLESLPLEAVTVRVFDKASLIANDVVSDFCAWADVDMSKKKVENRNESLSLSAMRLIHSFNKAQIVRSGDKATLAAYEALVQMIKRIYAGHDKLSATLFEGIVDRKDTDWLQAATGIEFKPPAKNEVCPDLVAYLQDITEIDADLLDPFLRQFGVGDVSKYDIPQKVVRLYLGLLMQQAQAQTLGELRNRHATRYPWKYLVKAVLLRLR